MTNMTNMANIETARYREIENILDVILSESSKSDTAEKKLVTYKKIDGLISESYEILDNLKTSLDKIKINDNVCASKIPYFMEILDNPATNFGTIIDIIEYLTSVQSTLPKDTSIKDNIENDTIFANVDSD